MSHRVKQLESALQRTIGAILINGLNDPRVSGLISVTGVEISKDGEHAKIGISVLPEEKAALTLKGLRAAARHIRHECGEKLRARAIPELDFVIDNSLKKQAEVLNEIRLAMEEASDHDATAEAIDSAGDAPMTEGNDT
ncbi:MAG: 30S ribosome-binding factor RbfA [Planctomycetota bacterium]|jgi:ribosome-binding factor A